jgi:cytochrome c oxidase subunit 3
MSHDTATIEEAHGHGDHGAHGHGEHGHMPFLAHHFDDPEQQFDSGKLGMWLFLVTEVLFFSGMFCAYALYRSLHPEVWTFASQFLNETLGAFNTGVLLFSSLSMAWGVRCAQLRQRTGLVVCLAITLGCASVFLGIKAIEYTHKWDLGLLPAGMYESQYLPGVHHEGLSSWLIKLSIVPALCVVGFAVWYV